MKGHLTSIDDLSDYAMDSLLQRAAAHLDAGLAVPSNRGAIRHAALLFFEASLRTRTGYQAAAQRLGWPTPVEVVQRRVSAESMPERLTDTVSVLAGYFDTLVVRTDGPVDEIVEAAGDHVTVVNAGDRGPRAEHPTQALIDSFAMSRLVGPVEELSVVLAGDLRMRAARSLLKLLARTRPRELVLVTDRALSSGLELPAALRSTPVVETFDELDEVDALHAIGIPNDSVDEGVRTRLRVDAQALSRLSARGRVFSPMPVIDEIDRDVRGDPRLAFIEQSALALPVRMAVLESLRVATPSG